MKIIAIIETVNAKKIYKVGQTAIRALNGVSIAVEEGEFCCIVGRSGSGKSTLLNLLAGLEPPTAGQIIIGGQHIEAMNESQLILFRQRNVGFMFQSFNLMPNMTAVENVSLPLAFRGMSRRERDKRAKTILKAVGLSTHLEHKPTQMSGGQQQRVGIARALAGAPKIIFADEPTGNLDSKTSEEIMLFMQDIMKQRKQTFIMVTHDAAMAAYADTTIHLLDGKVISVEYAKKGVLSYD